MRKIKRSFLLFFANLFSLINKIIPKKSKYILFFTNMDNFNDNNRALFEHLLNNKFNDKYKIFYSTPSAFPFIESYNVKYINIVRGLFVFLFSKYVFYDGGTTKIKPSKRQIVFSLWHGTPLKKIGRSVEKSSKFDRFNDFTYILTTSENCKNIFAESFECSLDKVIVSGYPRNDYLFFPNKNFVNFKAKKNVLWMPTFRNSIRDSNKIDILHRYEISIFKNLEELKILDEFLEKEETFLVIKHHPLSVQNSVSYPLFKNIKILNNDEYKTYNIQNYSFVGAFDCLITDYSSVYFDYLLLNKPIGFVIDDIEKYNTNRGFTFEKPLDMMPGKIIQNKDDFYHFIKKLGTVDEFELERIKMKDFIHTKVQDSNACTEILEFVGIV